MSSDPVVQQRLNAEWTAILESFEHWPVHYRRRAVRWLLVTVFGTEEQYHLESTFHAQVTHAEQMIDALMSLAVKVAEGTGE